MGAFKPLLPFGKQTVVEACLKNLREGGAENLIVVVGHRADELQASLAHLPVSFAYNADASSEMSVSIARGVEQVPHQTKAVLILPADHPAVPSTAIRALIEAWRKTGARLIVPEHGGRGGHPVLVDLDLRQELLNLDPHTGLRALFNAHKSDVLRLTVDSAYIARDMDTWEDYSALYRELFGTEPADLRTL